MDEAHRPPLLAACRVLFGIAEPDPAFLAALEPAGLRRAWRRRALATHPDRVRDPAARPRAAERFIEAARAYELLCGHLERRAPRPRPAREGCAPRHRPAAARPPRRAPAARTGAAMPRRPLRLGELLRRERLVTFEQLVAALLWQRRQRERFGEICRRWGLLDAPRSALLLGRRAPGEPCGEAAQRLLLLTRAQVGAVLAFQRSRQRPLGSYFVEQGLLTRPALAALLARLAAHNRRHVPRRR